MDLLDLFRPNKGFKRAPLRPNKPSSNYAPSESSAVSITSSHIRVRHVETGTDYVKRYVEEENRLALETAKENHEMVKKMDEMSVGTVPTQAATDIDKAELDKLYSTFNFEHRSQDSLPIIQSKDDILREIQTHNIAIIEGVTGCGKSTQVPQFILDDCYNRRQPCNIIVTQPRRIAALSIADRVAKERNWPLGSLVGVQVGMYKQTSKDTRLTYCTTGVLLRKLISAKNMLDYTHVVLDEVHERDQEMDFLLLVIRKMQRTNSRNVKVILMSATINTSKFSAYFSTPTPDGFVAAPIVTIPKKRNFDVQIHYLCQLGILGTLPEVVASDPRVSESMMKFCMRLVDVFDDIDRETEYDGDDLEIIDGNKPRHATLIFLPGIWEIEEMHNLMSAEAAASKWDIVILHSSITSEEQRKVFDPPPKGYRRVILSTNIAESSITINDVKYVIDFCLTKQLITDPGTNFQCLELTWASKANLEQRSGRAGRLMDGRAYRLIPESFYKELPVEGDPEIIRAPLENVVLQTKLLNMGEPRAVLALAIDPPDLRNLERTILLLKEAGGLLDKPGTHNPFDGDLTDLGRIMAALPIDIHIAKFIALGHVFNVLRETIIMGASMSLKSMFSSPFRKRMEAYSAKVHWADGSTSDALAFLGAYNVWQREIIANRFRKKSPQEHSWAKRNYIQIRTMHEVDYLVSELTQRLEHLGIKETMGPKKQVIDDVDRALFMKIVFAGAFYPNYFVRDKSLAEQADDTQGTRDLGGLDPSRTVYLHGWKPDLPGKLYAKRIQEIFKGVVSDSTLAQSVVEFDGSMRVYVMFNDDRVYGNERRAVEIPGKISLSVYKALKLRKMGNEIKVDVLDAKRSQLRARELNIAPHTSSMFFSNDNFERIRKIFPKTLPQLPGLDITVIPLKITNFEHPGKFWARNADKEVDRKENIIHTFLNDSKNITLTPFKSEPGIGTLAAVRWRDKTIYRVVVESLELVRNNDKVAKVLFMDYGFRDSVGVHELRMIKPDHQVATIRALAFECCLCEIEPSEKESKWSQEACQVFKSLVNDSKIYGTIYSVVDSIVNLRLSCFNEDKPDCSLDINDHLVELGLADKAEESFLSKYNAKLRERSIEFEPEHREYLEFLQYAKNFLVQTYPEPPPVAECTSVVSLKGPKSPLEISLSTLAVLTSVTKVSIEGNSVNSILLDTDPDDPHQRLLVSALVSQNQSGTQLTLRNTTLMPNIRGFAALMCLIFAPKIELRRSARCSRYIGALCGLGYDSRNNVPMLPEHDMEVYFDTEFTMEDLQSINRLRHWVNLGICVQTDPSDDLLEQAIICQRKVYEFTSKLIQRQVKSQTPEKIPNFNKWGLYDESLFLLPARNVVKEDSIYPLHSALILEKVDEIAEEMVAHAAELRILAASDFRLSRTEENMTIYCKMCEEEVFGREALRVHLYKSTHRQLEHKYGYKRYV